MRAIARRDNAIAQLERYRDGMGGRINRMIDEVVAQAGADYRISKEKRFDVNVPASTISSYWEEHRAAREAAKLQGLDKKPQPTSEVQATTDAQQVAAQPQKLAAVPDAPHGQPSGFEKGPAPVDAPATADAPKLQPNMPENAPQQAPQASTATDVHQAAVHAVPDAPHTAPVDASATADAPKLQADMPENAPQQTREAPSATNVHQAAVHPQKLVAVPDTAHAQPGGVDKEPAPVDAASAAADAQKVRPDMPENAPQQAREAPSATEGHPQ
jgi:hypothetical protein